MRILAFLTIFVPKKRNRVDNIGFLNNTERFPLFYSLAVVTMAVLLAAFIHDSSVMELKVDFPADDAAGFYVGQAGTVTLVSLWFAAGALAAMIVSLCAGPIWLQAVVFLAVSGVLLALLRPLVRRYVTPKAVRTNVDGVIGTEGYVTADIDNVRAVGSVKLGGMTWTARSTDGSVIPTGTLVKVDRIEGVKAFVTPVKEPVKS